MHRLQTLIFSSLCFCCSVCRCIHDPSTAMTAESKTDYAVCTWLNCRSQLTLAHLHSSQRTHISRFKWNESSLESVCIWLHRSRTHPTVPWAQRNLRFVWFGPVAFVTRRPEGLLALWCLSNSTKIATTDNTVSSRKESSETILKVVGFSPPRCARQSWWDGTLHWICRETERDLIDNPGGLNVFLCNHSARQITRSKVCRLRELCFTRYLKSEAIMTLRRQTSWPKWLVYQSFC